MAGIAAKRNNIQLITEAYPMLGYASVMSWMLFLLAAIPSIYFSRKRMAQVEDM